MTHRIAPPGALLVRVPVADRSWPRTVPAVPGGRVLTATLGHLDLAPSEAVAAAAGYRVVGIAADGPGTRRRVVDVLVPAELRAAAPAWWSALVTRADRVFDPSFGPVAQVMAAELDLHLTAGVA